VGANPIPALTAIHRNFNLTSADFQNGWPAARSNPGDDEAFKWHHSDFDYVAYPFTYKLFIQITTSGNLK
jgi:hypothetical protein